MELQPRADLVRKRFPGFRRWFWVLIGANGEVQSWSEPYTSKANARRGFADAKRNMAAAELVDRTDES